MQGILFEECAVAWESDLSKVIWLFGIEGNRKIAKPFKKCLCKISKRYHPCHGLDRKGWKESCGRECFGAEYWEEQVLNRREIISNCYFSHVQKSKASHSVTCGIEIT